MKQTPDEVAFDRFSKIALTMRKSMVAPNSV